ncbi:hypothetical protein J1614_006030 [Plenodomus biglobosus]|nr:hypothetical protein J1614_006030 [Plenodomus biglobosus]
MAKDSSFRLILSLLLTIQILCWTLTLLDLFNPGKLHTLQRTTSDIFTPLLARQADIIRTAARVFAPLVSRRAAALLSYTQIYEMIPGLVG